MEAQIRNEANELRLLFEVCRALEGAADFSDHLEKALGLISKYTGMMRGVLSLSGVDGDELAVETAAGLSREDRRGTRDKLGKGVAGKIVETGVPAIIPNSFEEPLFLNRTGVRNVRKEDIAFVCVPVTLDGQAIGALCVDRLFADSVHLEEDVRLLHVLASLFARAVGTRREFRRLRSTAVEENRRLLTLLRKPGPAVELAGNSSRMAKALDKIAHASESSATVLIQGEGGTGKEVAAGVIHANSSRMNGPFIKVNCAALPEALVESELFGYEDGAAAPRQGRFELAHNGTLFLDEVECLPAMAQARLLRVLREKELERVGGSQTRKVDVRLIAATGRDLEEMAGQGSFCRDLYYRLNIFPITLPPLRRRKEDIAPLCAGFLERFSRENNRKTARISSRAADLLMEHAWPGNVRELENAMQRAALLCGEAGVIEPEHLPPALRASNAARGENQTLDKALAALERRKILEALEETGGNMSKAAGQLGITERIMGLRMKKHGLSFRDFRKKSEK